MSTTTSDGALLFGATESGGVLTPTSNWSNQAFGVDVVDASSDGNADTGTPLADGAVDYVDLGITGNYTGYTVSIGGNDYAIFGPIFGNYYVPYFNSTANLGSLTNTSISQTISNSGNNANVVNLCFLGGTMIATPDGERLVEDLAIGDLITTADGRAVPVKWMGRQVMTSPFANVAMDEKLAPVCISAGVLGNHTDLYVTADHGMIVEGLVINASALVNGDTIRFVPVSEMPSQFTYYHIETEAHDVILANGAESETFIDAAGRAAFDNYQEYLDLYGVERIIPEMNRPRIASQRLLPNTIKDRFCIEVGDLTTALRA